MRNSADMVIKAMRNKAFAEKFLFEKARAVNKSEWTLIVPRTHCSGIPELTRLSAIAGTIVLNVSIVASRVVRFAKKKKNKKKNDTVAETA